MKIESASKSSKPFFEIRSVMVALYLLSSSPAKDKAKHISQLFFEFGKRDLDNDVARGADRVQGDHLPSQLMASSLLNESKLLRKDYEIKQIFSIFCSVALNLLPYFACDYPETDKSNFFRLFTNWNVYKEEQVSNMVDGFCGQQFVLSQSEFLKRV
jgi:hypothetical protein